MSQMSGTEYRDGNRRRMAGRGHLHGLKHTASIRFPSQASTRHTQLNQNVDLARVLVF